MHLHEHNPEPSNPLGMDGIEFVEFATSQPQALGGLLQRMGFAAIARHRPASARDGRRPRPGVGALSHRKSLAPHAPRPRQARAGQLAY